VRTGWLASVACAALVACTPAPARDVAVLRVRGYGEIRFALLADKAPHHVANFVSLAATHFYDGTTFHRVIPGFMIQGGDPLSKDADPRNDGTGTPGYFIKAEFNDVPHDPGVVSMARQSEPDTAGCQFFIMTTGSESWRPQLDGQYTVFGRLISGQDVVDRIAAAPRDARDRPLENVVIESVTIEPAAPGTGAR
jgi:cyclophilin family peptidyl-prolyl cis-trans isomerase